MVWRFGPAELTHRGCRKVATQPSCRCLRGTPGTHLHRHHRRSSGTDSSVHHRRSSSPHTIGGACGTDTAARPRLVAPASYSPAPSPYAAIGTDHRLRRLGPAAYGSYSSPGSRCGRSAGALSPTLGAIGPLGCSHKWWASTGLCSLTCGCRALALALAPSATEVARRPNLNEFFYTASGHKF